MASSLNFTLISFFVLLLLSSPVLAKDEADNLLQGLNSYRQSQNLPPFDKNAKAECVANEIADDMEHQPCTVTSSKANVVASRPSQLSNFPKFAEKCRVDANTTADAVVMPVCVPKLVQTLLLANYTHSQYAKYLNDSRFTGAGLGSDNDWMVVVLTTGSPRGSFVGSGAAALAAPVAGLVWLGFLFVMSW